MKTLKYYVLLARVKSSQPWFQQYGAYDRQTVCGWRQTYRDDGHKKTNLRVIISPTARQPHINAIVGELNKAA